MMPILKTKLFIPKQQPKHIVRNHLIERLNANLDRKLTMVIAPAGFGKSSLVSDWVNLNQMSCAWLSLDENDSDPTRFITYLLFAIQTIVPSIGESVLPLQLSPQSPPIDWVLTALINEVASQPDHYMLVLDDYHSLDSVVIDKHLAFLIENLPDNLHLVIISRKEPDLPLARLRGRNQIIELHSQDLRFTNQEVNQFLNQIMGLRLNSQQIDVLEKRTEGWVSGLQMAALSMGRQTNPNAFIQNFAGSHQFIVDYLIEEILNQQSDANREFLFQTSILNRLYGPLCDAITGRNDSAEQLNEFLRGGMFIIPLDDEQQWYRYHHLILEALRDRAPESVSQLHLKASQWYQEHGFPSEAIFHALAGNDFNDAGRLIGEIWPSLRSSRQDITLLRWMEKLPEKLIKSDTNLNLAYAWALLETGQLDKAEIYLSTLERTIDEQKIEDPALLASVANARAYQSQALQDMPAAIEYTQQALHLLAEDDYYERGTAIGLLALAQWANGDLEAAYNSFSNGIDALKQVGGVIFTIGGALVLAIIRLEQGRLEEGLAILQRAIQTSENLESPPPGTAELYLGCSKIFLEQGEFDLAREWLARGEEVRKNIPNPSNDYLWSLQKTNFSLIDGEFETALTFLDEAERLYYSSPIPNFQPIDAIRARIWLKMGKMNLVQNWVNQQNLSAEDAPAYLQEYRHIALAQFLIANRKYNDAKELLDKLHSAAEIGRRNTSLIEIMALQAQAYFGLGEKDTALKVFSDSLNLAATIGHKRIFLIPNEGLQALFSAAKNYPEIPQYFREIHPLNNDIPEQSELIEPLSTREYEVLQYLSSELSGPEMADKLMVSLNTVRSHIKKIYSKLGVNSRRSAVRKAKELGLI